MESPSIISGRRIRLFRERKGLSRARLAQLLAVDVTAVSAWENGKYQPRVEKRHSLARLLGVMLEELFPEVSDAHLGGASILQIADHAGFASLLLEKTARAERLIRAIHCSRVAFTPPSHMVEFRRLISNRLLADSLAFEHIEVVQDLSRLKEIVHNILRYDGHAYRLRAYHAPPSGTVPGPNAFLFDERDLLLGSSWQGEPIQQKLRLSVSGGEILDYYQQRWEDMWETATPLNEESDRDLSGAYAFALKLGLAPSDWPAFLEQARSLTIADDAPPFV